MKVDSNTIGSGIAAVMTYGRNDSLGINFLYGINAKQAIGSVLHGSYNTFLEQGCRLLVLSNATQTVQISVHRSDGTEILANSEQAVAKSGLLNFDLCASDEPNNYGVVTVQPETANSVVVDVIRVGTGDSYRFPTGLK